MNNLKEKFNIEIGYAFATKESILLLEEARFQHSLFIGPDGSTARSNVLSQIKQDVKMLAAGNKACLIVLDSKVDILQEIIRECSIQGVQSIHHASADISINEDAQELDVILKSFLQDVGVLLVNTSEYKDSAHFIANKIYAAAANRSLSAANVPVFLYINDLKSYANDGLNNLLMSGRSKKVGVFCLAKNIHEIENDASHFLSNISNLAIYGTNNPRDSKLLARCMPQTYTSDGVLLSLSHEELLQELENGEFYYFDRETVWKAFH